MSFTRLVYYGAIIGAWSAFLGWYGSERLLERIQVDHPVIKETIVFAIVGAAVGSGLSLVAGMANARPGQQLKRLVPGLILGGLGGAIGSYVGNLLVQHALPRALGWVSVGLAIGAAEGISERSWSRLLNGISGGALGGCVGGFLLEAIRRTMTTATAQFGQAGAFLILGATIGIFIGLTKVVLRHAWLTVVDGYGAGRQLVLSRRETTMGRAENSDLPFFSRAGRDLEPIQARVVRRSDGHYALVAVRHGTWLNGKPAASGAVLKNNDIIKLGPNLIRYNERTSEPDAPRARAGNQSAIPGLDQSSADAEGRYKPALADSQAPRSVAGACCASAATGSQQGGQPSTGKCPACGRKYYGLPGERTCTYHGGKF